MNTLFKLLSVLGLIGLLILLSMYIIYQLWYSDVCGNKINDVYVSPDHSFKALVYSRGCIQASGISTHISIIRSEDKLDDEEGNIFILDSYAEQMVPTLFWNSDKEITINFSRSGHERKALEQWGWLNKIIINYHQVFNPSIDFTETDKTPVGADN